MWFRESLGFPQVDLCSPQNTVWRLTINVETPNPKPQTLYDSSTWCPEQHSMDDRHIDVNTAYLRWLWCVLMFTQIYFRISSHIFHSVCRLYAAFVKCMYGVLLLLFLLRRLLQHEGTKWMKFVRACKREEYVCGGGEVQFYRLFYTL